VLRVDGERAIGLAACDIKGAAACLLAAAESQTARRDALQQRRGSQRRALHCGFLAQDRGYREAIVAEPTQAQAVLAHRGISSARIAFRGQAGHASAPDALEQSAVHQAMRWGAKSLAHVESQAHARFGGLTGLRFNIGRIEGRHQGQRDRALRGSALQLPAAAFDGHRRAARQLPELRARVALEAYEETFRGPSLPAGDIAQAEERRLAARDLADELGLPIGNAWISGPRRRCSPPPATPRWSTARRHRAGARRRRMGVAGAAG
jgi:acetylornithine deacetylase